MKVKLYTHEALFAQKGFNLDKITNYVETVFSEVGIAIEWTFLKCGMTLKNDRREDLDIFKTTTQPFKGVNVLLCKGDARDGLHIIGQTFAHIIVRTDCKGIIDNADLNSISQLLCHELGHYCGLDHYNHPKVDGVWKVDEKIENEVMQSPLLKSLTANECEFGTIPENPGNFYIIELPKMGLPVYRKQMKGIANFFCKTNTGVMEVFNYQKLPTYNYNSLQGYRHIAIDFAVLDPEVTNFVINPFLDGTTKVTAVKMNLPDDDKPHHASKGNYIRLEHSSGVTVELCHLKQNSAMVKVGDIVQPYEQLALIGWSGYCNKDSSHTHFVVQAHGNYYDLFEAGVYDLEDWDYSQIYDDRYPEFYIENDGYSFTASINNFVETFSNFDEEYTYTIKSERPIEKIMHVKNPYGEVEEFDILKLPEVNFRWSDDKKTVKFGYVHMVAPEYKEESMGKYHYYVVDSKNQRSNKFYINLVEG